MKKIIKRLLPTALAFCIIITLCACGGKNSESALDRIIDTKTIIFGIAPYNAPISWFDSDGAPQGLAADVGRVLAAKLDAQPVFATVREKDALSALNNNEIDCYLYLPDPGVKLSAQILPVDGQLDCRQVIVISSYSGASRLVDLRSWRVGVLKGSKAESCLSDASELTASFMSLETAHGLETLLGKLAGGEIGAVAADECQYLYATRGSREQYKLLSEPLESDDYFIVVQHNNEDLYSMIDNFMSAMSADGSFEEIRSAWLD